jgi:hypothetical protein
MLKHSTSATPSVNCLSCRHSSNTVMAAGQGDPAAGQAEHQNLSGRHVTIGEAPPDVVGVRQFGGILAATAGDVDTWRGRAAVASWRRRAAAVWRCRQCFRPWQAAWEAERLAG